MTKTQKEKWTERIIGAVVSVIVAIAIYSFTFTNDVNYTEQKELKEAVIKLDKEKASVIYVDQKCQEIKSDILTTLTEIKDQQKINTQDTKDILKLLIDQKK